MKQLRPISTLNSQSSQTLAAISTAPLSVVPLRSLRSVATSAAKSMSRSLAPLPRLPSREVRTLDFDIETVAAGFADPQWVPNRTTCWAYAWVDGGEVTVDALPVAAFYDKAARREFLSPLLEAISHADVLTGHNIMRFDLPVLNAECLLLNLPTLLPKLVQDTIRLPKTKGFKKGQDNMSHALAIEEEKMPLSWAQWEAAYGEPDLATVKERCASDVRGHLAMRRAALERGWTGAPRMWRP